MFSAANWVQIWPDAFLEPSHKLKLKIEFQNDFQIKIDQIDSIESTIAQFAPLTDDFHEMYKSLRAASLEMCQLSFTFTCQLNSLD